MTKLKTFKKIAAMVMTLAMMMSFVPMAANADDTASVYDHEIELLKKLEILPENLASDMSSKITRGEFSELLTAMLGVGGGGNAIEELYNLGIVHGYGNGKLKEDNNITTYEAVKMIVNALGYEALAELEGGYPLGYVKIAYDVDLISGNVQNEELTVQDAIRLMVDAGNSSMAKVSNDTLLGGIEMGGKTMFYTYFDVVRTEGVMTADGFTSIGTNSCIPGQVIINGDYFEDADSVASDFLGYYVEAYAFEDDMLPPLIAAGAMAEYNKEVTVAAESYIEATGNLAKFTVKYEDQKGAVKKITVGDGYFVIYNGKLFSGLTLTEHGTGFYNLNDGTADVTFVDNDRDGIYELIKIDEYETYVVKSTNSSTFDVYAKYDRSVNLDADKYDVLIYRAGGAEASFADLTEGTAISVAQSADGNFKKVYILGKTASGTISAMSDADGHQALTINGKEYIITKEFENLTHQDKITPIMGANVVAVLDRNGNIVDMDLAGDVWSYGYLMRIGYDENLERCTNASIFDQSNKKIDLQIGERLVVDGQSRKSTDLVSSGLCVLDSGYPRAVKQLIRYKAADGKLERVDTATYNTTLEDEDSLQAYTGEMPAGNHYFNKSSGYVYAGNEVVFGASSDTIVFTIPGGSETDLAFFYAQKMTDWSNKVSLTNYTAYNVGDAKRAKVVIRTAKDWKRPGTTNDYLIVKSVYTVINAEGEPVYKIDGIRLSNGAAYSKESTPRNTDTGRTINGQHVDHAPSIVLPNVQFGDCIAFRDFTIPDYGSVLWSVQEIFAADDSITTALFEDFSTSVSDYDTYASQSRVYKGLITYADDTDMVIENSDGSLSAPFKIKDKKVYVVDCADETITPVDAAAVYTYAAERAKTVVVTRGGDVYGAVIYTNY